MKGDSIVVEEHHVKAAKGALEIMLPEIEKIGESGSGKSEIAAAIAEELESRGIKCVIFQQDDYFVYPPRTNDAARRKDIGWVGPQEVRLKLMDEHMKAFVDGKDSVLKPLVIYGEDRAEEETMEFGGTKVAIADGTYTTLLENVNTHIFLDLTYLETRKHREKRIRHASELDPFIDNVLKIEHGIISGHKERADILVNRDYEAAPKP
jgi:uridine kinase